MNAIYLCITEDLRQCQANDVEKKLSETAMGVVCK